MCMYVCTCTVYILENIAVYSCYFIGQLQESILLRVHWISIYRVHALRAFSFIFLRMRKTYRHCNACDQSSGVDMQDGS